jgi:hypothetical protein
LISDSVRRAVVEHEWRPVVQRSSEDVAAAVDGVSDAGDVPVDALDFGSYQLAFGRIICIAGAFGGELGGAVQGGSCLED